jgi:hypothetical protein
MAHQKHYSEYTAAEIIAGNVPEFARLSTVISLISDAEYEKLSNYVLGRLSAVSHKPIKTVRLEKSLRNNCYTQFGDLGDLLGVDFSNLASQSTKYDHDSPNGSGGKSFLDFMGIYLSGVGFYTQNTLQIRHAEASQDALKILVPTFGFWTHFLEKAKFPSIHALHYVANQSQILPLNHSDLLEQHEYGLQLSNAASLAHAKYSDLLLGLSENHYLRYEGKKISNMIFYLLYTPGERRFYEEEYPDTFSDFRRDYGQHVIEAAQPLERILAERLLDV